MMTSVWRRYLIVLLLPPALVPTARSGRADGILPSEADRDVQLTVRETNNGTIAEPPPMDPMFLGKGQWTTSNGPTAGESLWRRTRAGSQVTARCQ